MLQVLTAEKAYFWQKFESSHCDYILRRLWKCLQSSIFRSRFPNYFLIIKFESSHTSYKRINTVDLSLARINYDLKIFMRETKFVLIYIFSILRSFNGYWCYRLKIPVNRKNSRHTVLFKESATQKWCDYIQKCQKILNILDCWSKMLENWSKMSDWTKNVRKIPMMQIFWQFCTFWGSFSDILVYRRHGNVLLFLSSSRILETNSDIFECNRKLNVFMDKIPNFVKNVLFRPFEKNTVYYHLENVVILWGQSFLDEFGCTCRHHFDLENGKWSLMPWGK